MTSKLNWIGIFVLFISASSFSGQSGYILNGKVVITHIDGKEVASNMAQEPEPTKSTAATSKRSPATSVKVQGLLHFDEDDIGRCYWLASQTNLQCIKK